jgi:hypothetical protein
MPVHCAVYVDASAKRRLSCLKLEDAKDVASPERIAVRFGELDSRQIQRLLCTCAPVHDYTGRQVARVGVFTHAADERPFASDQTAAAMDLARRISVRLGHLPTAAMALGA